MRENKNHEQTPVGEGQSAEDLKKLLEDTQKNISRALESLNSGDANAALVMESLQQANSAARAIASGAVGRVIEGVFNGEAMVGADGKRYNVPPNYASKSKLVEGDILKLTITQNGSFIYKQIGPIERDQFIGVLARDQLTGDWYAVKGERRWRVLTASVTYFHGKPGDQVVILVPKSSRSNWAAVENIIAA
ncbi:MAG: hypothetical protein G01um101431_253 [Parcubacteria group bacterium Gr01-1014_31]|nr:MAG: hypothetical protein G01um101431_253 [Parcubacteria group bacterium Gr01-1014_31]